MTDPAGNYEVRRFDAVAQGGDGYARAEAWVKAVAFSFHEPARTAGHAAKLLAMYEKDGRVLAGAYQVGAVAPGSLPADVPVATFATFRKSLNIGFGRMLESQLVTSVTVRTPHRRRGLLRRLMGMELRGAREAGVAVSVLNASEGSIYGRFGYGVASFERTVQVDTGPRFAIRHQPSGTVEIAEPGTLLQLGPKVFDRVHRLTPGSVARQDWYRHLASGSLDRNGVEDPAVKAALHFSADGTVDGYVAYRFRGWEVRPFTMDIVDLVAAGNDAYLELWQFLAGIDLIERVSWNEAPLDDPLAWALTDPRCIRSSNSRDMLWVRILDAAAALQARYYPLDGTLVLDIHDPLELTGGTYALRVTHGKASVKRLAGTAEADLTMDVSALSSIYLGGVSPVTLAAAGRIRENRSGAAFQAGQMFAVERATHCLTHF